MPLLRAILERLSLYLPVILMGVLAFGTYWLVRSTPLLESQEPEAAARHEPDYFMHQFSVKTFDVEGKLKSEVLGIDAHHFPDTDTLEINSVRIRSFDEQGQLTTAVAKHALTNGDASEVQLSGQARIIREPFMDNSGQRQPKLEFRGEFLHVFMKTERVTSHLPVELTRGEDQFTANSLNFNNQERVMLLEGRVKGTLIPKALPQ